jgi:crotonobetainyl-CoA:carnitine CoA-transferase CaiB-like acyl-CoA transferase
MWPLFCEAVELPELVQKAQYATNADRLAHREELAAILQAQFATQPTAYWEQRFRARKVLFSRIYSFPELLGHPAVKEAGIVSSVTHPLLGTSPQLTPPIIMSDTPGGLGRHPPLLGEHTREVLLEAGLEAAEVDRLIATKIAAEAREPS